MISNKKYIYNWEMIVPREVRLKKFGPQEHGHVCVDE